MMRGRFYLVALLIWFFDLLTKWVVRTHVEVGAAWDLLPGYLRISHVQNTGVAFGLFNDLHSVWKPYVLSAMAIVAIVVILLYSSRVPTERTLLRTALAVTLGGILGNFADRLARGYVVDFIEFHVRDAFHWPTFNVADTAITIGIMLLLIDTLKNPERAEEPETPV
jgi:signal peptidase II